MSLGSIRRTLARDMARRRAVYRPNLLRGGSVGWDAVARIEDSRRVPASMRRDVRVLGGILGQVISESDGADLLADIEDLRHRVIAARQHDADGTGGDAAA